MRLVFIFAVLLVLLSLSTYHRVECRPDSPSVSHVLQPEKVHTHLMIMFLSYAGDERRPSLRDTWLRDNANETRWVFVFGNIDNSPNKTDVLAEQKKYGDIIILDDVIDDYEHLSDKALKGFKAVHSRFVFNFLLKTDTDTFVILPRLMDYLETIPTNQSMYIGNFAHSNDPTELWYGLLKGVYYMLGGGYVLSYDLVEYFAHSQHLMKRSRSEDITVGIHLHSINLTMDALNETLFKASAASACSCVSTLILNHKCRVNEMYFMYYSYKDAGEICEYKKSVPYAEEMARKFEIPNPFPSAEEGDAGIRWLTK